MACRVVKDKVIAKHVLEDGSEKRAEMLQRNVEFYIPTVEEILTYAKDGYPSCEKSYQELFRFYLEDMELGEDRAGNLCLHAFHTFVASGKVNDYMEIVNRERIIFRSEEMVKKFTHILEEVSQNTRMFELRGHKPKEVAKKVSLQAPAHAFLSKPQKQQEKRFIQMTHVHVEVERNIRSAVGEINKVSFGKLDEKAEPKKVLPFSIILSGK